MIIHPTSIHGLEIIEYSIVISIMIILWRTNFEIEFKVYKDRPYRLNNLLHRSAIGAIIGNVGVTAGFNADILLTSTSVLNYYYLIK